MMTRVLASTALFLAFGTNAAAQVPSHQAARAALEAYVLDFWGKRDPSALDRALSHEMVYHYNGEVLAGTPADHRNYLAEFGGAFPDLTARIEQFTYADGLGAAVTHWAGTHKGELAGIEATGGKPLAATGRKVAWVVNYVFRLEGGRIVELWETWDEGGLYHRLLKPLPSASPKRP